MLAVTPEGRIDVESTVLNVRSGPGTDKPIVGTLRDDAAVTVECQLWGQEVVGTQRTSPMWNRIGPGRYIADAFVTWTPSRPEVPWCAGNGTGSAAVAASGGLNVRTGPGLDFKILDRLPDGAGVNIACQSWGTSIEGNSSWSHIGGGRFVSSRYIKWAPQLPWLPWCGQQGAVPTPGNSAAFVVAAAGLARESQRQWRVPASVTIAQAILESGWGRSTLTRDDHNYFGMKCFGNPGPVALGCREYGTHECSGDSCWSTRDTFRAYRGPQESYADHGRQLATLSRYAEAMNHIGDPDRFAREIHRAGYATGSGYADKLIDLMKQYDLYQYDRLP